MSVSPEMMVKVAEWRTKAREGTLTQDEMREAIVFLRGERTAAQPSATSRKSPSKAPVDSKSLFDELDNL